MQEKYRTILRCGLNNRFTLTSVLMMMWVMFDFVFISDGWERILPVLMFISAGGVAFATCSTTYATYKAMKIAFWRTEYERKYRLLYKYQRNFGYCGRIGFRMALREYQHHLSERAMARFYFAKYIRSKFFRSVTANTSASTPRISARRCATSITNIGSLR